MSCQTASDIILELKAALRPPPTLSLAEWADEYRMLSESSENSGRWKTDYTPYMRVIMDAISDPRIERVVMMTSAQVGKSELLNNTCFYYAHQNPKPQLMVQPTIKLAEAYSKERLQPTIDATPVLAAVFGDKKSRTSENTILQKMYPGGFLCLAGSNSPASLASRAVGVVLLDEVDRYPQNSGGEGDVVALAIKRTNTFRTRKIIIVSTPTDASTSRIALAYENSTKEKYNLICPACNEPQQIKHEHIEVLDKMEGVPMKVAALCDGCGVISQEWEWKKKPGIWVAEKKHPTTRGFHLNEWVSPWKTWVSIEQDYEEAKQDTETLRVWINTSAGEVYEEKGEHVTWENVSSRAYLWDHEVPKDIVYITAGVDVQTDRLAVEVVGYTASNEDYSLIYEHIIGDTNKNDVWAELLDLLSKEFISEAGFSLKVSSKCVDSGGHSTQTVYNFCKKYSSVGYKAIKGVGGWGKPFTSRPGKVKLKRGGTVKLYSLGVDDGKLRIMKRLKNEEKGADYSHFHVEREDWFYKELTAEKLATRIKKGRPYKEWVPIRKRNEALDCRNYANAALELDNPNLKKLHEELFKEEEPKIEAEVFNTSKRIFPKRKKGYLDI